MKGRLLVFFLLSWLCSQGQVSPERDFDLNRLADEIFPLQDAELNYEELYETLLQRISNPLDLNKATAEELRSLFLLNELQINELLKYRAASPLLSVYELQTLRSFDLPTLQRLAPFVAVENSPPGSLIQRMLREPNKYFLMRFERTLETKAGFQSEDSLRRYLGSPDKLYMRFRTSRANDFSFGFTTEKDAGEQIAFNNTQKGFDFQSAHWQVSRIGKIQNLIVGDFQAQFGQGLILGGGFGMGKGAETVIAIRRNNVRFVPYTSLVEGGFFRGAATTIQPLKNVWINFYGSRTKRDGNIEGDSTEYISSLTQSGLHRSVNELANRKRIDETNAGAVLEYRSGSFHIGTIFASTRYSLELHRKPTLYNQFSFSGDQLSHAGVFINYDWSNFTFFSEVAQSIGFGRGAVAGVLGSLSQKIDVSLLARSYARNFVPPYANAVAENSQPQNENGFYWGWKYTHSRRIVWSGYVDLFQFPWLRFRGYAPSNGHEWLMRLAYRASKNVTAFVQWREESKVRNLPSETTLYETSNGVKHNGSLNIDYKVGALSFQTRLQSSSYRLITRTRGAALLQDVSIDMGAVTISGRYALFNTADFDNRQYAYERDVAMAFSLPAYAGNGIRSMLMLRYRASKKIDIWLRYARTTYNNVESIGSGGEQMNGNTKTDVKFQTRIRF